LHLLKIGAFARRTKGLLATTDAGRDKLTVRKTLQGARRNVLHIALKGVPSAPKTGPSSPQGDGDGEEVMPVPWAGSEVGNGQANGEAAQPKAATGTPRQSPAATARKLGRLGRSDNGKEGDDDESKSNQHADDWSVYQ